MRLLNEINFLNIRGDLFGGVTAAIIALPMALAFGVASGAGPAAGLYGAVLVGLFAAIFGSTPTLISEPTGPMTVIMTAVIASLIATNPEQGLAMAFTVVMLAGVFQVLFGLLKLGHYVTMMPYTVVSGFMSGIGIILIILQLGPFLGHATPAGGVLGTIESLPELIGGIKPAETMLAVVSFGLIVLFPKKLSRYMPPQLLALLLGTLVSIILLGEQDIRRIGEIPTGLPEIQLPVFSTEQWTVMLIDALVLAVLGSIDALLTSVIAENMTRKESNANKELIGQGIGNLASGLFGGLPGAGATMGTVLNIKTGGRTALSGLIRAAILLVVVLWAAELTAQIPLAVLAGIALKVGFDIIDWSFLRRAHTLSHKAAYIMYGVIIMTVFVDLITAVAIGVFIANFLTIERITRIQGDSVKTIDDPNKAEHDLNRDETELLQQAQGKVLVFTLHGALIFGVAKVISRRHAVLDEHQVLVIDFTEVPELGISSSLSLEEMILNDMKAGRPVYIAGASHQVKERLGKLGILEKLTSSHILATREAALREANQYLSQKNEIPNTL
jgi:SulP family sulfate permease